MWNIIAGVAVFLSAINVLPQLIKSYKTKQTRDLSYAMVGIIISGNILWIAHGIHVNDLAILTANAILLITTIVLGIMKYKYDKKDI